MSNLCGDLKINLVASEVSTPHYSDNYVIILIIIYIMWEINHHQLKKHTKQKQNKTKIETKLLSPFLRKLGV